MPTVASLDVLLSADVSKFSAGLGVAGSKLLGLKAGPIALAVEAVRSLGNEFLAVINKIDDAGDKAANLGVAVDELTRLEYAAKQLDSSAESLDRGLSELQKRMPDIASGTGPAAEAVEALGLSTDRFAKLDPAGALRAVVAEMEGLPTEADKARVAYDLFGKGARDLFSLLKSGSTVLDEYRKQSDEVRNTVTKAESAAAAAAQQEITKLGAAWNGLTQELTKFEPIATFVVGTLTKLAQAAGNVVELISALRPEGGVDAALDRIAFAGREPGGMAATTNETATAQMFASIEAMREEEAKAAEVAADLAAREAEAIARASEEAANSQAAKALKEQEEAARKATEAQEALADAARDVWESTRTPAEAAALEIDRLNGLFVQGYLDADTFARRLQDMEAEFATPQAADGPLAASAGAALEASSAAAFSALLDAQQTKPAEDIPRRQLVEQERSRALLERVARALEELTGTASTIGAA